MFSLKGLTPDVRELGECAFKIAHCYGLKPVVTSTFRGWAEQLKLRQKWESGLSKFPANRPGDSAHNYGLAFDSWVPDEEMGLWVAIRRSVGLRVPDGDLIHAERPEWRSSISSNFAGSNF